MVQNLVEEILKSWVYKEFKKKVLEDWVNLEENFDDLQTIHQNCSYVSLKISLYVQVRSSCFKYFLYQKFYNI